MAHTTGLLVRRGRRPSVLLGFTVEQADKARLLIADGAVAPYRGRVVEVVSSDGARRYLAHPATCTCPAGLHDRRCYHSAAAALVASGQAARDARNAARRHWRAAHRASSPEQAASFRELARASSELARRLAA